MKVFLSFLILALPLLIISVQFTLPDGNPLLINSSFTEHTLSVSLSSHGCVNSKFTLKSEALSPKHGSH